MAVSHVWRNTQIKVLLRQYFVLFVINFRRCCIQFWVGWSLFITVWNYYQACKFSLPLNVFLRWFIVCLLLAFLKDLHVVLKTHIFKCHRLYFVNHIAESCKVSFTNHLTFSRCSTVLALKIPKTKGCRAQGTDCLLQHWGWFPPSIWVEVALSVKYTPRQFSLQVFRFGKFLKKIWAFAIVVLVFAVVLIFLERSKQFLSNGFVHCLTILMFACLEWCVFIIREHSLALLLRRNSRSSVRQFMSRLLWFLSISSRSILRLSLLKICKSHTPCPFAGFFPHLALTLRLQLIILSRQDAIVCQNI